MEILGYAKFMKELVTKKRTLEYEMIEIQYNCSAILIKHLLAKKHYPCAFIISSTIKPYKFRQALYELGANINLMPLVIFEELGLDTPSPMKMHLLMAD